MDITDPTLYLATKGGEFEGTPEIYFGTPDYLLSAGGMYNPLYNTILEYRTFARPTSLMFRGDYGRGWDKDKKANLDSVHEDILTMRGNRSEWWRSRCNIWVWKNLAYGYRRVESDVVAGTSFHLGWPQAYPSWWDAFMEEDFRIAGAGLRIFRFPSGMLGDGSGAYFVVMSKLRKEAARWPHNERFYKYRRGFSEVVPVSLSLPSSAALRAEIEALNPTSHFDTEDEKKPWIYVMPSTYDRLRLAPKMGSGSNGSNNCSTGILGISEYDPAIGTWGPELTDAQMIERYLPRNVSKAEDLKKLPLITVWELDDAYLLGPAVFGSSLLVFDVSAQT